MRPTQWSALTAFVFLSLTGAAEGALTHRYSFNDGTAADSVGTAHGVPINGARIAGGRADLVAAGRAKMEVAGGRRLFRRALSNRTAGPTAAARIRSQ